MNAPIRVKPHHLIDIITEYGAGRETFKPDAYGTAVHAVANHVLAHREARLVMELGADAICAPCCNNEDGVCTDTIDTSFRPEAPESKREWNLLIDHRWCERIGLRENDELTARAFCARVRDRMGDITDIYREIPAEMTAKRARNLAAGLDRFLV